mgnify:CR=1 FL=1
MKLFFSAGIAGAIRAALIAGIIGLSASGSAWAQDAAGSDVDPNVFNLYLQSRLQQRAPNASAEEIEAVRNELADIYLLSSQPRAEELQQSPFVSAQLELQSRAILAQAVATDFVANNQPTEEEIQASYDEIVANPTQEYKARHILVETQGEAIALVAELEGGADFGKLAKEKSTGPSGPTGGDLGWFPPDRMVPEFSAAVATLADGEFTTEPVLTQFGWHVILREGTRDATAPTFDSVKEALKQQLEAGKLQEYLEGLRNQ